MAKITPISEHFQHFLAEMKEFSGAICMGRRSWRGSGFSSCSQSGNETAFRAGVDMSGGRVNGGITATATTSARTC